jgi:hypothetical protein
MCTTKREEKMQELSLLDDHFPEGLEKGLKRANDMYWNLTIVEKNGIWSVLGGDKDIFRTDNKHALDAFLYGLGLAYNVIPEEVFANLLEEVKPWVE